MFKQLVTLVRGQSNEGTQAVLDANALSLLRQQMRDAAQGVNKSRKAVAVVIAYAEREKASLNRLETQISDLEARALDALEQDSVDLASEAAGTIAQLEAERDTTRKVIEAYQTQILRLKQCLTENETCLRKMKRGQHLAEANDKAQRLSGVMPSGYINDLKDAEATLKRLQERREHAEATATAMVELSAETSAESMTERLAEAGYGAPLKADAAAVLDRLKKKAQ